MAWLYDLAEATNGKCYRASVKRVGELVPQGSTVLDCAAGTCAFSMEAAKRAKLVLCTDLSRKMLDRGAKKAKRAGLSNLSFAIRDITCLSDPDGAYDVVLAANVLHLLPQPMVAARELWRVTKPGGRLILPTFLQGRQGAAANAMVKIYQGVGFHYEYAFTPESYKALLAPLGEVHLEVIPGKVPEGIAWMDKEII